MATKGTLNLKGLNEMMERLAELGKNVNQAAAEGLTEGGAVALDGMLERVPRDTGNLADHLKATEAKTDGNFTYVEIGLIGADADTARYGNAQEFGTSSMEAHPYIRNTFDEDKAKIRRAIVDSIKGQIGGK